MNRNSRLLTGIGVGAGLMYLLDPNQGRKRRARVRDQIAHGTHKTADALDATGRDVTNRLSGAAAEIQQRLGSQTADDRVLVERVRAAIGRVVSHPHAIQVSAHDSTVRLSGPILSAEVAPLLSAVSWVQGVAGIDNHLEPHDSADGIPALQGGTPQRNRWLRANWSPTTRLLACAAGGALVVYGSSRRNALGTSAAIIGLGLLGRSVSNLELSRLVGVGAGRRAVDIQKTIEIGAPLDRVFDFWNSCEDLPRYTSSVIDVRPSRIPDQLHWTVSGLAGQTVEFDTIVTERRRQESIAWKTVEGSAVGHAGIIRFEPIGDGATRLHIRISYNPPAGAIGHTVGKAFGVDLKTRLDEDLARIKTALETGRPPHDAARPSTADMGQVH